MNEPIFKAASLTHSLSRSFGPPGRKDTQTSFGSYDTAAYPFLGMVVVMAASQRRCGGWVLIFGLP